MQPEILYQDDNCLMVNKPAGLLSIPGRENNEVSLRQLLIAKYGEIFTIHRLDKDTSGIIIFAKNADAHKYLSQQFEQRQTRKIYLALVCGSPLLPEGMIDKPIGEHPAKKGQMMITSKGKEALTRYHTIEQLGRYSLMEFQIFTGRTHQIRVHAREAGCPVACDLLYGDGQPILLSQVKPRYKLSKHEEEERPILNRLALHAAELTINLPHQQQPTNFTAPLPKEMRATITQLQKLKKNTR